MIGCYTGLRGRDYSRLQADQFHAQWEEVPEKPKRPTKRWSSPCILWWMKSYAIMQLGFPSSQVDQTINRHLKLIGEIAEIDDLIEVRRTEGGQTMTKRVPKYQLIKTHTARRSFCTNAYKAGMDCLDIMALSGHTNRKVIPAVHQDHHAGRTLEGLRSMVFAD